MSLFISNVVLLIEFLINLFKSNVLLIEMF